MRFPPALPRSCLSLIRSWPSPPDKPRGPALTCGRTRPGHSLQRSIAGKAIAGKAAGNQPLRLSGRQSETVTALPSCFTTQIVANYTVANNCVGVIRSTHD